MGTLLMIATLAPCRRGTISAMGGFFIFDVFAGAGWFAHFRFERSAVQKNHSVHHAAMLRAATPLLAATFECCASKFCAAAVPLPGSIFTAHIKHGHLGSGDRPQQHQLV